MRSMRKISVAILSTILITLVLSLAFAVQAQAQTSDPQAALQRGYSTGYSDGFMAGYKDIIDSASKDYTRHAEYTKADRAYNRDYGTIEDYRDGYQQGFESGYNAGFEKQTFEATIPSGLQRRSAPVADPQTTTAQNSTANNGSSDSAPIQTHGNAVIIIPRDTELILELQDDLSTQQTREGSRFTAKVTAPSELAGATMEGRVAKITQPGRFKKRSEMSLSFDRIVLSDNRWSNFSGVLTEVIAVKGDNVQRVDNEGTAIGQQNYKQTAMKIGAPTGAGMLIGGITGGPVGVAVGAGVGAAFGVGAVVVTRGKHIRLNRNQQLRVKSSYETQIR